MTDNTVTVIAIIVPAIVTLIVSWITIDAGIKNNKAKISGKRTEMAYEKQIEAFREIIELVGKTRYHSSNKDLSKQHIDQLKQLYKELFDCYQRQRAFLPGPIDATLGKYLSVIFQYTNKESPGFLAKLGSRRQISDENDLEIYNNFYSSLKGLERTLVEEIHKFLGIPETY